MHKLIAAILVGAVGVLAFGAAASAQGEARVRVLHASPDAPAVDIFVDGAEAISDLAFDDITDYVALPAGAHTVEVFPAAADGTGDAVISADVTLAADTDYTVAAVGRVAEIEPLVLVDDNSAPAAGEANLRFVHASPDAPAVDIYAEGAGVVVPNAAFKDFSGYLSLPAGTFNLEVRAAGTETVALDLPGITLDAGVVYTAFAVGLLDGDPALNAKLTVDATAPHSLPVAGSGPLSVDGPSGVDAWVLVTAIAAGVAGIVLLGGALRLATVRARQR